LARGKARKTTPQSERQVRKEKGEGGDPRRGQFLLLLTKKGRGGNGRRKTNRTERVVLGIREGVPRPSGELRRGIHSQCKKEFCILGKTTQATLRDRQTLKQDLGSNHLGVGKCVVKRKGAKIKRTPLKEEGEKEEEKDLRMPREKTTARSGSGIQGRAKKETRKQGGGGGVG